MTAGPFHNTRGGVSAEMPHRKMHVGVRGEGLVGRIAAETLRETIVHSVYENCVLR